MREFSSHSGGNRLKPEDFRRLVEASPSPVAALSADRVVLYAAPALVRSIGSERERIEGASFDALVHPEDRERLRRAADPGEDGAPCTLRLRQKGGGWKAHLARAGHFTDSSGGSLAVLQCWEDAAGGGAGAERHGVLPGLPDADAFLDRLGRTMGRAQRSADHLFAVLCVEVQRFDLEASVNGNGLLPAIAARLTAAVRPHDTVAHLGGDTFAILADRIHAREDALRVAQRIHRSLGEDPTGVEMLATASIGVTLIDSSYESAEDLLRDAASAMSRAKIGGRSSTVLFDPALHARAVARLELEGDLRRAVERDEFTVHYQPIVELASGGVTAFEALVRWRHPQRGLVAPGEFITAAEETGLVVPMCASVLRLACTQARRWQDLFHRDPPISVSMNFTGPQFTEGAVMDAVVSSLQAAGLEGRQLVMEIKEDVAARDPEGVVAVLLFLKSLGVAVHLDDFGAGTSSLSVLHRLPADALKIDRSFMAGMESDPGTEKLVRAMVELGHSLGRRVIAEGIETEWELSRARELGCEYGQGFYFGRPMEADAASTLLAHDRRW